VAALVISSGDWDKKWRKCTIMALLGLTTAEREIDLKRQPEEITGLVFLDPCIAGWFLYDNYLYRSA
jgi:hypothetical protein